MQEIHEISASIEIMGKAFVDIAKKLKNIKVRVHGDKFKKKRIPTAYNCFVKSQVRKGANMKVILLATVYTNMKYGNLYMYIMMLE